MSRGSGVELVEDRGVDALFVFVAVSVGVVVLVGVPRATATRTPRTPRTPTLDRGRVPENKLTDVERAEVLRVVNSTRFVDLPPIQIYAQLLDEGVYLGSISTIYRVLTENLQVKERRRLARHPARAIPELVATRPGQAHKQRALPLSLTRDTPGWCALSGRTGPRGLASAGGRQDPPPGSGPGPR